MSSSPLAICHQRIWALCGRRDRCPKSVQINDPTIALVSSGSRPNVPPTVLPSLAHERPLLSWLRLLHPSATTKRDRESFREALVQLML